MELKYILKFDDDTYYGGCYHGELEKVIRKNAEVFNTLEEVQKTLKDYSFVLNRYDADTAYVEIIILIELPEQEN
jgi:hypothetical protein